jgi:ketosteroid isomerase-like protein
MAKRVAKKPARKAAKGAIRPAKKAAPKPGDAAAAIRRLDAAFMKATDAKDVGALVAAFYAPDAVLLPPNHPIVEGRESIRGYFQGLVDAGFSGITLETTKIVSAGNVAYGRGRYALTISPPGGPAIQDTGKYIVCYGRQANGSWRAVDDIFNSDLPAQ